MSLGITEKVSLYFKVLILSALLLQCWCFGKKSYYIQKEQRDIMLYLTSFGHFKQVIKWQIILQHIAIIKST